jgi:hypothetical protein
MEIKNAANPARLEALMFRKPALSPFARIAEKEARFPRLQIHLRRDEAVTT